LENLAYSYINLDQSLMKLIGFICILIGGGIHYLTSKSSAPITRSMYFFSFGVLFLASALEGLIWLAAPSAIVADALFIIVLVEFATFVLFGYLFGFVATGRSKDAYGTTGKWWYGFLPLINLVLLFKPSISPASSGKWKATILVILAFIMMGLAQGLSVGILKTVERNSEAAANQNPIVAEKLAQAALNNGNLEDVLIIAARGVSVPIRIDEVTTLSNVSARGKEIRFRYTLANNVSSIPDSFATNLQRTFCTGPMKEFIAQGATVTADYQMENGTPVRVISVNSRECNSL